MKAIAIVLVLLIASVSTLSPRSHQAEFEEANRLYSQGRYRDALAAYQRLEKSVSSWKVYFNTGNALYKLNRPLEAKVCFLRARKWKPASTEIETNIQIVNRHFKDRIPAQKRDFFTDIYLRIESILNHTILISLLFFFAFLLNLFLFFLLKGRRTRIIIYGAAVSLLLFALSLTIAITHQNRLKASDTAVIKTETAEIRSGPGRENTVLFKVNCGLELKIREKNQDWVQVSASNQIAGWIEADSLQEI